AHSFAPRLQPPPPTPTYPLSLRTLFRSPAHADLRPLRRGAGRPRARPEPGGAARPQHRGAAGHGDPTDTVPGLPARVLRRDAARSEEHTSELQSRENLVCRLPLEKKKDH